MINLARDGTEARLDNAKMCERNMDVQIKPAKDGAAVRTMRKKHGAAKKQEKHWRSKWTMLEWLKKS